MLMIVNLFSVLIALLTGTFPKGKKASFYHLFLPHSDPHSLGGGAGEGNAPGLVKKASIYSI